MFEIAHCNIVEDQVILRLEISEVADVRSRGALRFLSVSQAGCGGYDCFVLTRQAKTIKRANRKMFN